MHRKLHIVDGFTHTHGFGLICTDLHKGKPSEERGVERFVQTDHENNVRAHFRKYSNTANFSYSFYLV